MKQTRVLAVVGCWLAAIPCHAGLAVYEGANGRTAWANAFSASQQTITFNEPVWQSTSYVTTQYMPMYGVNFTNPYSYSASPYRTLGYADSPADHTVIQNGTVSDGAAWQGVYMRFTEPQRAISYNRIGWTMMYLNLGTLHVSLHGFHSEGGIGHPIAQWNSDWTIDQNLSWDTFVGLVSDEEFYSARVWFTQDYPGPRLVLDDISFSTVPAPGALALLALAGRGPSRRRRR